MIRWNKFLIVFFLSVLNICAAFGESLKSEMEKKYGKTEMERYNAMQNPGKLNSGVAQNHNETEDMGAVNTKKLTKSEAEKQLNYQMIDEAIKAQKYAMEKWGKDNKNMEILEPLRNIK